MLPRLLLIEDDAVQRAAIGRLLCSRYSVVGTASAEHALDFILNGHRFDVLLCDLGLQGWSGADLYRKLKRRGDPHAGRFVLFSGRDVKETDPVLSAELGSRLVLKPMTKEELLAALAAACSAPLMVRRSA